MIGRIINFCILLCITCIERTVYPEKIDIKPNVKKNNRLNKSFPQETKNIEKEPLKIIYTDQANHNPEQINNHNIPKFMKIFSEESQFLKINILNTHQLRRFP
jgi:hypothetical protein